jgi:hypothetical protein
MVKEWQTRDCLDKFPNLNEVDFRQTRNFHELCECGLWIEVELKAEGLNKLIVDDYEVTIGRYPAMPRDTEPVEGNVLEPIRNPKRFLLFAWDIHDNLIGRFISLERIVDWRDRRKPDRRFTFDILDMNSGDWHEMHSSGKINKLDDPLEDADER